MASSQCPGPCRSSTCMKQGISYGRGTSKGTGLEIPQGTNIFTSPVAEAEAFPPPAVRSAQPHARELLHPLWLLSHCFCFCCAFLSNSPNRLSSLALPPATEPSACDGWEVEGDAPGEFIQQPSNYAELYNLSKILICPWKL